MEQLRQAIEELYRVFRPYRVGKHVDACTHCVDEHEALELGAADLTALSVKDLDRFSQKALTTWGNVNYFRHFLPRLLELAADYADEFTSVEVLFGKLHYGKWLSWPRSEQKAVATFMELFWIATLSTPPTSGISSTADTVLCAIGSAVESVEPFLQTWSIDLGDSAAQHFARFVDDNADTVLRKQRLSSAYWANSPQNSTIAIQWLSRSPAPVALANAAESLGSMTVKPMLEAIRTAMARAVSQMV